MSSYLSSRAERHVDQDFHTFIRSHGGVLETRQSGEGWLGSTGGSGRGEGGGDNDESAEVAARHQFLTRLDATGMRRKPVTEAEFHAARFYDDQQECSVYDEEQWQEYLMLKASSKTLVIPRR